MSFAVKPKKHNNRQVVVFIVFESYGVTMRGLSSQSDLVSQKDEMLTTGEAAKLLNCTRQHVVDLCERGDLPYTSVGTHRRVSREYVEAIKARTDRLSRDERRSLWLAHVVAGRIATAPTDTINSALAQLDRMRPNARGQAQKWLKEWDRLLNGPVDKLLAALTDRSLRGRELRQNSPFAGALTEQERLDALREWRAHDVGNQRNRR